MGVGVRGSATPSRVVVVMIFSPLLIRSLCHPAPWRTSHRGASVCKRGSDKACFVCERALAPPRTRALRLHPTLIECCWPRTAMELSSPDLHALIGSSSVSCYRAGPVPYSNASGRRTCTSQQAHSSETRTARAVQPATRRWLSVTRGVVGSGEPPRTVAKSATRSITLWPVPLCATACDHLVRLVCVCTSVCHATRVKVSILPPSRTPTMLTCHSTTPPCPSCAQYNISNPSTGSQKTIDIDSDAAFRPFLEKRISHEVPGDSLGDDFKVRRQCVVCGAYVVTHERASEPVAWPGLV
jgi:hypothetical protein